MDYKANWSLGKLVSNLNHPDLNHWTVLFIIVHILRYDLSLWAWMP